MLCDTNTKKSRVEYGFLVPALTNHAVNLSSEMIKKSVNVWGLLWFFFVLLQVLIYFEGYPFSEDLNAGIQHILE